MRRLNNKVRFNKIKLNDFEVLSLATTYPEGENPTKGSFVHLLNKELARQGLKVVTVTPHLSNSLSYEELDSVVIKRFRFFPEKYENFEGGIAESAHRSTAEIFKVLVMTFLFFIAGFRECIKNSPDVIHAHWAFPGALLGYMLSSFFRKKFFVTIYGAEFALLDKKFKFLRVLVRNILNKSEKVIAITKYARRKAIELGVKPDKIMIIRPIPNYVKFDYNEEEEKEFRKKFVKDDAKIVLFVGRLIEHKGVSFLIKSFEHFSKNEIHVIVAGGGPQYDQLKELTKKLEIEQSVSFVKNPSDYDVGLLYCIADIFVLPSVDDSKGDTEGFGVVMLEAMKCKSP